jgi:hypothetical protein
VGEAVEENRLGQYEVAAAGLSLVWIGFDIKI